MIFIVLFKVVNTFSNLQATFPLIFFSSINFGILTLKFHHKSQKNMTKLWYQNQSGFEENWVIMLWIMSGFFDYK